MDPIALLASLGPPGIIAAIAAIVIRVQYQENRAKDAMLLENARKSEALAATVAAAMQASATATSNHTMILDRLDRRSSSQSTRAV